MLRGPRAHRLRAVELAPLRAVWLEAPWASEPQPFFSPVSLARRIRSGAGRPSPESKGLSTPRPRRRSSPPLRHCPDEALA